MKKIGALFSRVFVVGFIAVSGLFVSPPTVLGKTIGIVYPESAGFFDEATEAFKIRLAAAGFGPQQVDVYILKPALEPLPRSNTFRNLIDMEADLIVVYGDSLLLAVCREKTKIPVLYGFVMDPDRAACARSAEKTGGNALGVSGKAPLRTLLEKARLMSEFKTVSALDFAAEETSNVILNEIRGLEKELVFSLVPIPINNRGEAVAALRDAPPANLFLAPDYPLGDANFQELIALAVQKNIQTISLSPPRSDSEPLLGLYPDPEEQGRLMGDLAVQILKSEKPGNPRLGPKKIELEVNLPLAKKLGVKVPMALLDSATKIIK